MSRKIKFKGQMQSYVQWPLRFSILVVLFNIAIFFVDKKAGYMTIGFSVVYISIALFLNFRNRNMVINELVSFATRYGQVQRQLLRDLEIPYALLDENGKIIWTNESFEETLKVKRDYKKSIMSLIPALNKQNLPNLETETEVMISHFPLFFYIFKLLLFDNISNNT